LALRARPRDTTRGPAVIDLRVPTRAPLVCRSGSHALAGTALDLLVRATIAEDALRGSAASLGAGEIAYGPGIPPAIAVELQAVSRVNALQPWDRELAPGEWRGLARLYLLLARFEQAARSEAAVRYATDRVRDAPPTLAAYSERLVQPGDSRRRRRGGTARGRRPC
jgi:hypothetical protein